MADVQKTLKDALYVTVGLGVIGFQKAQVRRRELTKQVESQLTSVQGQVAAGAEQLDKLTKQVREQVTPVIGQLVSRTRNAA
jgi:hypothetical protein